MTELEKLLSGGDLRSIGNSNSIVAKIKNQNDFDELFMLLFHTDRLIAMRAADAIEKITIHNPHYLAHHKEEVFRLCNTSSNKELKWHLAQILPRLPNDDNEIASVWSILSTWATNRENSNIVRVNALQGLFDILKFAPKFDNDFRSILIELKKENIPSINARIRIISKQKV
ncbi:MAG: hypothetical protein HYZ54_12890 [Ignavibacteriae bacterium]|nr:hypothetical protein [Ignavibacteriota bacterium]